MKKILISLVLVLVFGSASAQIGYQQTYNNRQQQQSAPRANSQSYRTTAYTLDQQGNVYKMPIMVEVINNGYGSTTIKVTQKYINTGLGGQWQQVVSSSGVSKCTPMIGNNPLESEFMYKAHIDLRIWYFDL